MSSELFTPAYADPHYGLIKPAGIGYVLASGAGTPTALSTPAAGYEKGCIFINRSGTVGSLVYVNTGTTTAAVWTAIV